MTSVKRTPSLPNISPSGSTSSPVVRRSPNRASSQSTLRRAVTLTLDKFRSTPSASTASAANTPSSRHGSKATTPSAASASNTPSSRQGSKANTPSAAAAANTPSSRQGSKLAVASSAQGSKDLPMGRRLSSGSKDSKERVKDPLAKPGTPASSSRPASRGNSKTVSYAVDPLPDAGPQVNRDLALARRAKKSATLSQDNLRVAQIHLISRKHRLEQFEVKRILEHFDQAYTKHDGKLSLATFRDALKTIFERPDLDEKLVERAWKDTQPPGGEDNSDDNMDINAFFSWYVANMFSVVAQLSADKDKAASEAMVYELAKKHDVTPYAMDKVKMRFDQFDTDKSGAIEYPEFKEMMTKMVGATESGDLSEDRIQRFWKEIDVDGNQEVDFGEFTEWYIKYFNPDGNDNGGPIQAFYASYDPAVQRHEAANKRAAAN